MDTQVVTLRSTARDLVIEQVSAAAHKQHERNYEKLHINRDGSVNWSESINESDDIIDRYADHFCAVPSVITAGTGSYSCNCPFCDEIGKYLTADGSKVVDADSPEAEGGEEIDADLAISNAVSDNGTSDLEDEMVAAFDAIDIGYFDDEEAKDESKSSK
jgi:hypothetical protein